MTPMVLDIPVVETERLVLRGLREADVPAVAAFYATERAKWVGGLQDPIDCWRIVATWLGHWVMRGYGMWAIEDRASGQMAGLTGFIFRDGWDEPELGWHIYGGFEGKSIAYEAASAARSFGAAQFGLDGVISYIAPDNTRSVALATRLGARFERNGALMGTPCHVYRHPAAEEIV